MAAHSIATQFDTATIDFYSFLAEQNLSLAAQVGCALRAMVDDRVLDEVQQEMVSDCLQKLGKAGVSALHQHCQPVLDLPGLVGMAQVCAVAGPPHDQMAMSTFASTTAKLVEKTGRGCLDALLASSSSTSSSSSSSSSTTTSSSSSSNNDPRLSATHLQHARFIFTEAAQHINALSGVGFSPTIVLGGLALVCASCATSAVAIVQHFQKMSKLNEWVRFSNTGGAPPRRAKKAGLLVQEIIDPLLNQASELCQEFSKFHTFVTDVETNLNNAAAQRTPTAPTASTQTKTAGTAGTAGTAPSASESIRKIREAGQELMVGYMMVEAYCVTRNLTTAVDIAVVDGYHQQGKQGNAHDTGHNEVTGQSNTIGAMHGGTLSSASSSSSAGAPPVRQSPSISLVEESFFIFKLRFSRAVNTLHIDAPRFILNRLQAALEETVLPEIRKLLSLESTLNVACISLDNNDEGLSCSASSSSASSSSSSSSSATNGGVDANHLTSDFNATLNLLLEGNAHTSTATGTDMRHVGHHNENTGILGTTLSLLSSSTSIGTGTTTASLPAKPTTRQYPLASLLVAACSARKAQQHAEDFVLYVRGQFETAFGSNTLSSVEPMLDELNNLASSFKTIYDQALEELASTMDQGIKTVIKSTTLLDGEKYDLDAEEFQRRQVNDLFALKTIDHLHSESSLLQKCKQFMNTFDYSNLVKVVATHISTTVEKVWMQMRVNVLGGLLMERDLRTLIDQISRKELESGSVRLCFSRLTALVWLVNLENPTVLVDEDTALASQRVLSCLNYDEVCARLHLRLEFRRNFDKVLAIVDQFFARRN